jgi:hypothetical protein
VDVVLDVVGPVMCAKNMRYSADKT